MQLRGPQFRQLLPLLWSHWETQLSLEEHTPWHFLHRSPVCLIIRGLKSASWWCSQDFGKIPSSNQKQRTCFGSQKKRSLEFYVDYDFSGNWHKPTALKDFRTAKFCTSYTIMYAGCPIIWDSNIQTHIALSTTEAEYMTLSQSFQDCITVMLILH